mmetsp:Transcript_10540/g.23965  ORF Transcript_10540/g.23965 Transcript_10540/m.23965 type:complete len:426 (-) Transcript_10540:146-1423(-)
MEGSSELQSLKEENARLREELQRFRAGSHATSSAGLQELRSSRSRFNCVSQSAQVWREGAAGPVSVEAVKEGDKVLAVDLANSQSPSVAFVPVQEISKVKEKPEGRWLRISLADGSQALVTAGHPVFPERQLMSGEIDTSPNPVKAEELQPGVDRLVVMKFEAVAVTDIKPLEEAENPAEQVRLRLSREALDSNSGSKPSRPALMLASSAPKKAGNILSLVALGDRSSLRPRGTEMPSEAAAAEASDSDMDLDVDSGDDDEAAADEDELEIILGGSDQRSPWLCRRVPGTGGDWQRSEVRQPALCLSEMAALPRDANGARLSFGSLGHVLHNEACKVCVFNRKLGVACRHSWLCNFCHAKHQPYVRPSRRSRQAQGGDSAEAPAPYLESTQQRGFAGHLLREEPAYVNPMVATTGVDMRQCKVSI